MSVVVDEHDIELLVSQLEKVGEEELKRAVREVNRRRRANGDVHDNRRGYVTHTLPLVDEDDPDYWSVSDAVRLLESPESPWLNEVWFRQLINLTGMKPAGRRPSGSKRRHVRVYDASKLAKAYTAMVSVMNELPGKHHTCACGCACTYVTHPAPDAVEPPSHS